MIKTLGHIRVKHDGRVTLDGQELLDRISRLEPIAVISFESSEPGLVPGKDYKSLRALLIGLTHYAYQGAWEEEQDEPCLFNPEAAVAFISVVLRPFETEMRELGFQVEVPAYKEEDSAGVRVIKFAQDLSNAIDTIDLLLGEKDHE